MSAHGSDIDHRSIVFVAVFATLLSAFASPARADDPPTDLERVVAQLGEEAASFDPGAIIGISVERLDEEDAADFQGDRWLKSASSLKPTWVAAAILAVGVEEVAPYAQGIWVQSSNRTGGQVIRLAGGLDPVNAFTASLGMDTTLVVEWTPGGRHVSSEYPGPHPALNFTTTDDLVRFWRLLDEGAILTGGDLDAFSEWARLPRQPGYPSGLLTRLPEGTLRDARYKMGWLPPGRTEEDEDTGKVVEVDALDTLVGGGILETPGGVRYAVAIGSFAGTRWPGKVSFVAYAACRIHETLLEHSLACDRSGDPRRTRLDTDPPFGGLDLVAGGPDYISVRGWAVDPDDHRGTIWVRFTVDGAWTGAARADQRHSWGGSQALVDPGHGYERTLLAGLTPGSHEVCAWALNDGEGPDTEIGCAELRVE